MDYSNLMFFLESEINVKNTKIGDKDEVKQLEADDIGF